MMNHYLEAVARSKPRALLVTDMPFLSFHLSPEEMIRNSGGFLQRRSRAESSASKWCAPGRLRNFRDGPPQPHPSERQCHGWVQGAGPEGR